MEQACVILTDRLNSTGANDVIIRPKKKDNLNLIEVQIPAADPAKREETKAILTKVDEAVKVGPSVDTLIRHQIQLRGVTNGQRVPEDWERANAQLLVSASMRSSVKSAFDPQSLDLDFFFTPSSASGAEAAHA